MRVHRRRLAVRILAIGWKADISSGDSETTEAKIVNLSTGGAYLMTEAEYQLDSKVNLRIKSPQMSFFVTAIVLRNDPYGIAVRFLDLCESSRCSILEIISQFLSRTKLGNSVEEKTSVCTEGYLELSCDL
jgi:c-di-GMP-binding flagellar brake protein YcgR